MPSTTEFCVPARDSAAFALLSGDYNPLHLDRIAARRTQFGDTVVHGIHLLLATLDRTAASWSANGAQLGALSFVFNSPVRTGIPCRIQMTPDASGQRIRFVGEAEQRVAFTATAELQPPTNDTGADPEDAEIPAAAPKVLLFPATDTQGTLPLRLARTVLSTLFPALAQMRQRRWIADLLASTRIVGMECPGLHSVYSTGRLRRLQSQGAASMSYRIERSDERFQLIRIALTGGELGGQIEALFRPPPVPQLSAEDIGTRVARDSFRGQRALVIGGSRGLGELTAKIIAAGGGEVTITYSRGHDDAARICDELRGLGRSCGMERFEVGSPDELPAWLSQPFSHVYFFASPPIPKNSSGRWDPSLFEPLSKVYVHSFAAIAQKVIAAGKPPARDVRFLYPSSVFLAEYEKGFAEYCVAKAAGEALCTQLQRQHKILFACPRLPRMRTDQTSGVRDAGMPDSFEVMQAALREFCATPSP